MGWQRGKITEEGGGCVCVYMCVFVCLCIWTTQLIFYDELVSGHLGITHMPTDNSYTNIWEARCGKVEKWSSFLVCQPIWQAVESYCHGIPSLIVKKLCMYVKELVSAKLPSC